MNDLLTILVALLGMVAVIWALYLFGMLLWGIPAMLIAWVVRWNERRRRNRS